MRKSFALTLIVLAFSAAQLFAVGEARLTGKVVDANDKPVAGATIQVTGNASHPFSATYKSGEDGKFAIFLLDGTIPYKFVVSKEGVGQFEKTIKLKLVPEKNEETFRLGAAPAAAGAAVEAKPDPAVVAFNDGVALFNEGKTDEAITKFEESVTLKPDLTAGWKTLALAYYKQNKWAKVIEAGEKAQADFADDEDLNTVMAVAYDKSGDKVKAAEYRKRAPANAGSLFNDAAKLINAGKDGDAEPLLKQAIAADPKFTQSYYELGMIYVRGGKNADAKTNLEKYLELDPNGRDAATAKEMLKYIK